MVVFPIIVDHKHRIQDDGEHLQNQGQDGELQPHVGGVSRHPQTNSAYLSAALSESVPPCLSVCLYLGVELCKKGEESHVWF